MGGRWPAGAHRNHSGHPVLRRDHFEQRHPADPGRDLPAAPARPGTGKEPPPPRPAEAVIGQFESLLIVGTSVKVVEPVVARLSGGAVPALADNAQFAADRLAQFRDAPLYYGWLNAKTLFEVLARIPPPE